MIFLNAIEKKGSAAKQAAITFTKLLGPLAPHLAEELWEHLKTVIPSGVEGFVIEAKWPEYDESQLIEETFTLVVQVNGKVRANLDVPIDIAETDALKLAKEQENVQKFLEGKETRKEMYVPGKLVSLVV